MNKLLQYRYLLTLIFCFVIVHAGLSQVVPIKNYTVNEFGQAQLEINSATDKYYILKLRVDPNIDFNITASMTLGEVGSTTIIEALSAFPLEHYQVLEYSINSPQDIDGDGIDDVEEHQNQPDQNPLNAAESLDIENGSVIIENFEMFNQLSISETVVQWSEFLNGKRYAKFLISDFFTDPKTYFINGSQHKLHADFINAMELDIGNGHVKRGQIVYHPTTVSNSGTLGTFAFNFSDGHGEDFEVVQMTHELLAANMPFFKNNLAYYVTANSMDEYERDSLLFQESRVPIVFENDVFGDLDYWGLNQKEGFGFFRELSEGDIPDVKDIVLYKSLPNNLPRIGGMITSVLQTPLSHVNLRAIQDEVPNAFIRDAHEVDSIASLLNKYIYFKVESNGFVIREATKAEVDQWFDGLRPEGTQTPPLNLDFRSIMPLDQITFSMYDGFGAKCANVATLRTFDLPEGTVPNGYGVPFYFYQNFMEYNGLFDEIKLMISDGEFVSDRNVRNSKLEEFRDKVKDAEMPHWMLYELEKMQNSFPEGTSIRCRSSTNNEDLPGFNGAGLYDSKTQHPSEGHISKSIKQVYASLWNLRAFEERDFYRVDHYKTSMGVLCHPNYSNEQANGVGVSSDPIYDTFDSFYYLNTQIGEDLITNPNIESVPEEILLDKNASKENDYILIRNSSLNNGTDLLLNNDYRSQLREALATIHSGFEPLYKAEDNTTFAMEIEYKITSDGFLAIKQARPWVSYVQSADSNEAAINTVSMTLFPNPSLDYINIECNDCKLSRLIVMNLNGELFYQKTRDPSSNSLSHITTIDLPSGVYMMLGISEKGSVIISQKFVKL